MTEQPATQVILRSLQHAYALIRAQEDELGNLDAAAGDGDHGAAMVRGLGVAVAAAEANATVGPGEVLALARAAFADEAGGASGALERPVDCSYRPRSLDAGPYDAPRTVAAMHERPGDSLHAGQGQAGRQDPDRRAGTLRPQCIAAGR